MGEFFQTYFDFSIMGDNFNAVLEGFWWTIKLSLIGGAFALREGLAAGDEIVVYSEAGLRAGRRTEVVAAVDGAGK